MIKIFFILFLPFLLFAKTLFLQETIQEYLNEKNPYYYETVAKQYISKENELSYQSSFDTQINIKYNNKRYPTTQGEYQQVDITKSIANGMEFSLAYRNAQGTQEYNNIKTGEEGEIYTSVNIPVLSLLNNTSKNQLDLEVAQLKTKELTQESQKNILALYLMSSKIYFELLVKQDIYQTEKELLQKSQHNFEYISKEVQSGKLAKIALLDVRSQIIHRKQRLLSAQNKYQNFKNTFLKYLNLSEAAFDKNHTLPSIKEYEYTKDILDNDIREIVLHNRPEFQQLEYLQEQNFLHSQYNTIKKYPTFNMKLNGVYDVAYEKDGYKIAMEFNYPLERSGYKGKNERYKKELILLKNSKQTIQSDIETNIKNILQKISLQEKNILLAKEEIDLVRQLESAEVRRYQEGLSSLLFVNQREILTLQAKQKLLKYYFEIQLLNLQLKFELGTLLDKG